MPSAFPYNRAKAVEYAQTWALSRNPRYFDFEKIGGDCTNFASQVLNAGGCNMNYGKPHGWYYIDGYNKSPSWTGVNFLYNFLMSNKISGPFAIETNIEGIEIGDLVQLNFENDFIFEHSLIVTQITEPRYYSNILVCSHTNNRLNHPLSSIMFEKIRYLHIGGTYK